MQQVFNWHLTQRCNYSCNYCFAKWTCHEEIFHTEAHTNAMLAEFAKANRFYPFSSAIGGMSEVRVNFVGGEPLLYGARLVSIIKKATTEFGLSASIVTNGSLLERYLEVAEHVDVVGLSVDSFSGETNNKIGRLSTSGQSLAEEDIGRVVDSLRKKNSSLRIKFNTVVNEHNWEEDVVRKLVRYSPDKIKVFRQLPFGKQKGISDCMFNLFCQRNECDAPNIVVEDNFDMTESYLMVAPDGRFFQNGNGYGYVYSSPIHQSGIKVAMSEIEFDVAKYTSRYGGLSNG